MISRKRILSNSCQHLSSLRNGSDYIDTPRHLTEQEDVWYDRDKLSRDHIQEILNKYEQLDDEIWGKIICMERNRRVAKAYARANVITVNGGEQCFDGCTIGLAGFENPHRDKKVQLVTRRIGEGIRIRYDNDGNILVRALQPKRSVYVKEWHQALLEPQTSCLSEDLIKARGRITHGKSHRLFEMRKFLANVSCEMLSAYPDRRKLETQCVSVIGFSKNSSRNSDELLDQPIWLLIINIVALEMLKSESALDSLLKRPHLSLISLFEPMSRGDNASLSVRRERRGTDNHKDNRYLYANTTVSGGSSSVDGHELSRSIPFVEKKSTTLMVTNDMFATTNRRRQRKDAKILRKEKDFHDTPFARSMSLGSTLKLAPFTSPMILEELPDPDYDDSDIEEDPYYCGLMARVPAFKEAPAVSTDSENTMDMEIDKGGQVESSQLKRNDNSSIKSFVTTSCLNSVLRLLPLQAASRNVPDKTQTIDRRTVPSSNSSHSQSNSGSSVAQDADEIYAHIYSSIPDAKVNSRNKGKAKRSKSIPKTWKVSSLFSRK